MLSAASNRLRTRRNLRELFRARGLLLITAALFLLSGQLSDAQTTAQLTGTVTDATGAVVPGAQVTLIDEATGTSRVAQSNAQGLFTFPSLVPDTYTVRVTATGFQAKELKGIMAHAGQAIAVPPITLLAGATNTTVTVEANSEVMPTENGARTSVLDSKQIQNLALLGRDTTELLKVLPGATTMSAGLSQNSSAYNSENAGVQQSAIGNGVNINGSVNRGGTALLADGANVIDPGNMASSISVINPEMTQEVSVQASAFGADTPFGPVVVSTISKSGGDRYHGEAYFDARNSVLNANDWQSNHQGIPQGAQHYYYPGGNFGGPVPGLKRHLFFWGGYERWLQNQGNSNVLKSYIPSPEMMAGDFTTDNPDNQLLCPQGFFGTPSGKYPQGNWCNDLSGTIFPDGTSIPNDASGTVANSGNKIPSKFIDPGAAALAKIWPKANVNPANVPGGYNYFQPVLNINNGWIYRLRVDYHWGDHTQIYGSYQQAYNSQLAQGNGAHLYWTPGNSIPFPGGGISEAFRGKAIAGHFVHMFSATATNDLMAAWSFGSFPFVQPDPKAASRDALGYPYGKVFQTASINIPAYSSQGNAFPDFSQPSIFENPPGMYAVRKEAPQFNNVFTKIWGRHTAKFGAFTQNTDNYQSTFSTFQDGNLSNIGSGQNPNIITGQSMGSFNPVANFTMGLVNGYSENNASPIADVAYQVISFFAMDTWKMTPRLTVEYGARVEHVGHWYDRGRIGMAVFYPDRVLSDWNSGKYAPGYYWHAIQPSLPLSGQPNRVLYFNPRFGLSYDLHGNGSTIMRGGWGAYRFVTQVNDVSPPLVTAQHVLGYNLPGQKSVLLSQLSKLSPPPCTAQCSSGAQAGFDPNDFSQPVTYAYNFTVDQRLGWNTLLDIAYVGSSTTQLSDNSEGIEGSNFAAVADQNKTPIGALFQPDPKTHVLSTNPENVAFNPTPSTCVVHSDGTSTGCFTATGNTTADYHPFGFAYGTAAVAMDRGISFTNYNALQVSWMKTAGRVGFNLNGTWSRTLGTSLQANPFDIRLNYGPPSVDRPLVFNASYYVQTGNVHMFNGFVNGVVSGWTISGISTWQKGGYIPAALGNGVPNFSLGLTYTGLPANASAMKIGSGIGAPTYFGTDAALPILPMLTCDPTLNLGHYQRLNGNCFNAPPVGQQGGQHFPYMSAAPYISNDLSIFRAFRIPGHEGQQIQFRASAFDWLNHPLPNFDSALTNLQLRYNVDYNTKAISKNFNTATFGVMNSKTGPSNAGAAPMNRVIELNVKYFF